MYYVSRANAILPAAMFTQNLLIILPYILRNTCTDTFIQYNGQYGSLEIILPSFFFFESVS